MCSLARSGCEAAFGSCPTKFKIEAAAFGLELEHPLATRELRMHGSRQEHVTRRVFDGYHDPEIGDVGRVFEVAVLTDRGEMLSELLISLERLMSARNAALDRLRAEHELRNRI